MSSAWAFGVILDTAYAERTELEQAKLPAGFPNIKIAAQCETTLSGWQRERLCALTLAATREVTKREKHLSLAVDNNRGFGKRSRFGTCATEDNRTFWLIPQVSWNAFLGLHFPTTDFLKQCCVFTVFQESRFPETMLLQHCFRPRTMLCNIVSGKKHRGFSTVFQKNTSWIFNSVSGNPRGVRLMRLQVGRERYSWIRMFSDTKDLSGVTAEVLESRKREAAWFEGDNQTKSWRPKKRHRVAACRWAVSHRSELIYSECFCNLHLTQIVLSRIRSRSFHDLEMSISSMSREKIRLCIVFIAPWIPGMSQIAKNIKITLGSSWKISN